MKKNHTHSLNRLIHTVRYLRYKQLYFRLYYKFNQLYDSPKRLVAPSHEHRTWITHWASPGLFYSTLTESRELQFLGKKGIIQAPSDWQQSHQSKLWLYNLHYFNELSSINAEVKFSLYQSLIKQWIQENPPGSEPGWDPYPLSLRIVNLVKWYSRFENKKINSEWSENLGLQVESLLKKIEYHILGNHLFANAKALVFAGAYFKGARADYYLKKGLTLLDQQIKEQFLDDGGHFELSPMYHAALLWDVCDLLNLSHKSGLLALKEREIDWMKIIVRGSAWLRAMTHPDGRIAFFNDAAFDIAPEYSDINQYSHQLGIPFPVTVQKAFSLNYLQSTGYCVINLPNEGKAILDIAKIGPDYQPGHAHADTLSFELSLFGRRFLVNSGTSEYGDGLQRHYERSTKAHNTVRIDEADSSEVWSGFRVAKRAFPKLSTMTQGEDKIFIAASHNGFRTLPGRNIHQREWSFYHQKLIIKDIILNRYKQAESRLFFHPEVVVETIDKGVLKAMLANKQEILIHVSYFERIFLESTFWYPKFGEKHANTCLVVKFSGKELLTELFW